MRFGSFGPIPVRCGYERRAQCCYIGVTQYRVVTLQLSSGTEPHVCPTQILLSCETHFQRSVSSTKLGSILTAGDILKHLELSAPPPAPPPPSLLSDMPGDSLPANLSVQMPTATKRRGRRVPFQNHSSHPRRKRQNKS